MIEKVNAETYFYIEKVIAEIEVFSLIVFKSPQKKYNKSRLFITCLFFLMNLVIKN